MEKTRLKLTLFFLGTLAFFLRLVRVNDSFWLDEAAQALESLRPLKEQLQIAYDFQPPLYHLLVHFISRFCAEEWWLQESLLL